MNFVKLNKYILILVIINFLLSTETYAAQKIRICFTGKVVENLPTYKDSIFKAADLALYRIGLKEPIEFKEYFYTNRPLEPLKAYSTMLRDKCSAIIGFEYLSDLLLILNGQTNNNIPILTSYASSKQADRPPNNVFLFMPSYDFLVKKMLYFLNQRFKKLDDVLVITQVNRIEMTKYKELYLKAFDKQMVKYNTFDFLEHDNQFQSKLKTFIAGKNFKFVFLLCGGLASAKIADIMNNHTTVFIGTENFGSSSSPTFYIRLLDKNIKAYFIRNLDFVKTTTPLNNFIHEYTERFRTRPTVLSAYVFDAMNILLRSVKTNGTTTTNDLYKNNYNGITGAFLKNNKFYRSNHYMILSVNNDGYKYEE